MPLPLPARDLVLLTAAAALVRWALLDAAGVSGPIGPDMAYWGYNALQLGAHTGPLTHPPLLPLAGRALSDGLGLPLLDALWGLVLVSGLLLPAALALAVARLGGPLAGRLAGLMGLALPATTAASVMVEPAAPALLLLAAMLWAAVGVARDGGRGAALALGALGALAAATKEGGPVDLLLLALPAIAVAPTARGRLAVAVAAAALLTDAAIDLVAPAAVAGKASVPLRDAWAWVSQGQVPSPLFHQGDDVGALDLAEGERFLQAAPAERLALVLGVQLSRAVALLGPLLLAAPAVAILLLRGWRRGQRPAWQVALVLPHLAAIGGVLVVVVQGRHAEWLALGTLWGLALVLAEARPAWQVLVLASLAVHAALRIQPQLPHIVELEHGARIETGVAAWALDRVPEGAELRSTIALIGPLTGRLVLHGQPERAAARTFVLVRDGHTADEGPEAIPPDLLPVAPFATLDSAGGRFLLLEARTEDGVEDVLQELLEADGSLRRVGQATPAGTESGSPGTGRTERRAKPGRTRHQEEERP